MTRGAVFLDRDGVINANVINPVTGAWESPHHPRDFRLHVGVLDAVSRLVAAEMPVFVVSNQPSYAKGKTTLANITAVAQRCSEEFGRVGLQFTQTYYCLHHPDGVVPGYSGPCRCRKPSPFFLHRAAQSYRLDLGQSWMVGDRASDMECGRSAGTRTILVAPDHPGAVVFGAVFDSSAADLVEAVDIILNARS